MTLKKGMLKEDINEELQLISHYKIDYTFLRVRDMRELYRRTYKAWLSGSPDGEVNNGNST
jgi:hypothetical protein